MLKTVGDIKLQSFSFERLAVNCDLWQNENEICYYVMELIFISVGDFFLY